MEAIGVELPEVEHREWLLDGLARLIRLSGWKRFVASPILRPTSQHFPDQWEQGPRGVRTLLRRLLVYAGLEAHRVKLHVYREQNAREFDQHGMGHAGPGTAAWFAGIADEVCTFGVNANELKDTEELVGTLGHEVAHAFRYHHQLVVRDFHVEERLTDLTSVYLGFGVFLLNSSFSFKTGGYSATGERLLYEKRERGYLSLPQIALLLGAQLAARGVGRAEQTAILAALSPNQAGLVEQALESFQDAKALRARLGMPEPDQWGTLPTLEEIAVLLDAEEDDEIDDESSEDPFEAKQVRTRARAFRVLGNLSGLGAAAGAVAPFLVAMLGLIDGWMLLVAPLGLGVVGWVLGSRIARDECSACSARIRRGNAACESCGASFAGNVKSRDERLAAEEQLDESEPEAEAADEYDWPQYEPESRLMTAMYAAWAIRRDLIAPDFAESQAELVVRVRCGEFLAQELSAAYLENDLPSDVARRFFADYSYGRTPLADQDFSRLVSSVKLSESEASYRRVAEILEARFDAWLRNNPVEPAPSSDPP